MQGRGWVWTGAWCLPEARWDQGEPQPTQQDRGHFTKIQHDNPASGASRTQTTAPRQEPRLTDAILGGQGKTEHSPHSLHFSLAEFKVWTEQKREMNFSPGRNQISLNSLGEVGTSELRRARFQGKSCISDNPCGGSPAESRDVGDLGPPSLLSASVLTCDCACADALEDLLIFETAFSQGQILFFKRLTLGK